MNAKQFAEQSGYSAVMALYDGKGLFLLGRHHQKLLSVIQSENHF